jgi:thymidylate synthase (FAD)
MKQGSSPEPVSVIGIVETGDPSSYVAAIALDCYHKLIKHGVAPEMARMVLPLSTYTEFWATMSLAAAARVVTLRADPNAQHEIRLYAGAMTEVIMPLFPVSWSALTQEPPP